MESDSGAGSIHRVLCVSITNFSLLLVVLILVLLFALNGFHLLEICQVRE